MGHKVEIQSQQTPFFFGDSRRGYDISCGSEEGLGWGDREEVSEKGSVKQTTNLSDQYPYFHCFFTDEAAFHCI